jgi:hypothetical protein
MSANWLAARMLGNLDEVVPGLIIVRALRSALHGRLLAIPLCVGYVCSMWSWLRRGAFRYLRG